MPDQPAIPFRLLRAGLRLASRASTTVVDRVLREGAATTGALTPRTARAAAAGPIVVEFDGREVPARVRERVGALADGVLLTPPPDPRHDVLVAAAVADLHAS